MTTTSIKSIATPECASWDESRINLDPAQIAPERTSAPPSASATAWWPVTTATSTIH